MRRKVCANCNTGVSNEQLLQWVHAVDTDGVVIHNGRNTISRVDSKQYSVTVKRFSRSLKNIIIYAFRKSKAQKSYDNALTLISRGIVTPEPYGYIEKRGLFNILRDAYYICRYDDSMTLSDAIQLYGLECMAAFAGFVARLHEIGIRHDDLNNTNVRVHIDTDKNFVFSLIDLNRMKIYKPGQVVPLDECFRNISRFGPYDDNFSFFVDKYIDKRHLSRSMAKCAIEVKKHHDSKVDAKKRFKKLITLRLK